MSIIIDNQNVHVTNTSKFLGVYIDDELNRKTHTSYVAGKIARGMVVIGKACNYFNKDCMINFYNAFIYPNLMCCN